MSLVLPARNPSERHVQYEIIDKAVSKMHRVSSLMPVELAHDEGEDDDVLSEGEGGHHSLTPAQERAGGRTITGKPFLLLVLALTLTLSLPPSHYPFSFPRSCPEAGMAGSRKPAIGASWHWKVQGRDQGAAFHLSRDHCHGGNTHLRVHQGPEDARG
eukprot:768260-Hanusia_phi.AAC.2